MPRLLDEDELGELAHEPGFDSALIRKLRQQRRMTFGLYLDELSAEFKSIANEALERAANAPNGDPHFLQSIVNIKLRFTLSVWLLRASLWVPGSLRGKARQITIDLVRSLEPVLERSR